eukprot:GHVR01041815.1.p2 GENE.GHVR01041815.1~~GHVR01041815.1.p2  ORF type:complete len:324 (-),score=47.13 GHVR01041815.1:24-995(-)
MSQGDEEHPGCFAKTRPNKKARRHPGCSSEALENYFGNSIYAPGFEPLCTLHSVVLRYRDMVLKAPRTSAGKQLLRYCCQDKAAAAAAAEAVVDVARLRVVMLQNLIDTYEHDTNEHDTNEHDTNEMSLIVMKQLRLAQENLCLLTTSTTTSTGTTSFVHLANVLMEDADVFLHNENPYWVLPVYDPLPPLDLQETNWETLAITRLIALVRQCSSAWKRGVVHNDLRVQNVVQNKHGNAHLIDWDFGLNFNLKPEARTKFWSDFMKKDGQLNDFVQCSFGGGAPPPPQDVNTFSGWVNFIVEKLLVASSFDDMETILEQNNRP